MNPELKRNIWLELTPRRLIAMPVVLGLLFMVPASFGFGTRTLATGLFFVLTLLWGTRQAAEAVPSEVSENTWDWQRLSTLSAWQLTWGKLIGATLYTWYGGILCILILMANVGMLADAGGMIRTIFHLVGASLIAQGVAFLTGLQMVRLRGYRSSAGTMAAQLIGIIVGVIALQVGVASSVASFWSAVSSLGEATGVTWFGIDISARVFSTLSLFIFLGWTLLACYRLMMRELQYKTLPWAWPAFVLFCCLYGAGFVSITSDLGTRFDGYVFTGRLIIAFLISALLTYVALFWEDKDPVVFRRLLAAFKARNWKRVGELAQSWMVSLLITAIIVVFLLLFGDAESIRGVTIWGFLIAALLFMLRDIAINLYLWLSPRRRRANLTTVLVLGLLYWVAPAAVGLFGSGLTPLFYPWAPVSPMTVIVAGGIEAVVMLFLLASRWRGRFQLKAA